MLQYTIDLIAYVALDSLQVFIISNLIILVILVSSLKSAPDDQHQNPSFQHHFSKSYDFSQEEYVVCGHSGREVSIIVKEIVPASLPDSSWITEVQDQLIVDDRLSLVEVANIQSGKNNDDLLRLEGARFYGEKENNSHEINGHVEEDDQFRKRVEAFISEVNNGLRDEMMQATTLALRN